MESQYGKDTGNYWYCNETGVINTQAQNGEHADEYTNGGEDCEDIGSSPSTSSPDGSEPVETSTPTSLTGNEPIYCDYFPNDPGCEEE